MLTLIKEQFNKIIQALIYTALACTIYGVWSWKAWNLWYVTLLIIIAFIAVGVVISYFWIKSEVKQKEKETVIENKE